MSKGGMGHSATQPDEYQPESAPSAPFAVLFDLNKHSKLGGGAVQEAIVAGAL